MSSKSRSRSSGRASSMSEATSTMRSRAFAAARFTALPMLKVISEPPLGGAIGVESVSPRTTVTRSSDTPATSAALVADAATSMEPSGARTGPPGWPGEFLQRRR